MDDDAPSICKLNAENSSNVVNILYGYFCYKKNKLKWAGSLQDLKAFVLTEVNELVAVRGNLIVRYYLLHGKQKVKISISKAKRART